MAYPDIVCFYKSLTQMWSEQINSQIVWVFVEDVCEKEKSQLWKFIYLYTNFKHINGLCV